MAEYIYSNLDVFKGRNVLELGAGIGFDCLTRKDFLKAQIFNFYFKLFHFD